MSDIADGAFWRAVRPVGRGGKQSALNRAIRAGRAGRHDEAWTLLGEHFLSSLADEWEVLAPRYREQPQPAPETLRALLAHNITCWHNMRVQFGDQIDWYPDELPHDCKHGFHYMGWLHPAVVAFVQDGDNTDIREFLVSLWRDWYYGARRNTHWRSGIRQMVFSGLGIAARWEMTLICMIGLLRQGACDAPLTAAFAKSILGYGRTLLHDYPVYVKGCNALAVGATALLHIARLFPEFRESAAWEEHAWYLMRNQVQHGFYADGGNKERVWGYGLMHVHPLMNAYDIGKRSGGLGRHGKMVLAAIRRACQWYGKTAGPAPRCLFPAFGDAGTSDNLGWLRSPELYFPAGTNGFAGIDRGKSYLLQDSGFAIMRNGDHPDASYANINFGEFGGWHSHADLLSLNFWALGERLLEEVCRFGPYANPLDTLFRAPEMHNQVLIDGMVYDNREVAGIDVCWHSDDNIDYFSACHRAYRYFCYGRGKSPVSPNIEGIVRRTVMMVKDPGYLVVLDSVADANRPDFNRAVSQYWHAPRPFISLGRDRCRIAGERSCLMVWDDPESLHRLDTGVDWTNAEVANLGTAEERYSLRARRWMPLSYKGITGFLTIIYPFVGDVPTLNIKPLDRTTTGGLWRSSAFELHGPFGVDRIVLNPELLDDFRVEGKKVSQRARWQRGRVVVSV